jgi:hypothetical protein
MRYTRAREGVLWRARVKLPNTIYGKGRAISGASIRAISGASIRVISGHQLEQLVGINYNN